MSLNQQPSENDKYKEVYELFEKKLLNLSEDRLRELNEEIRIATTVTTYGGHDPDPFQIRYALLKEHAENIGKDFLSQFDSIIRRYCGKIEGTIKQKMVALFYNRFRWAVERQRGIIRRLLASFGRIKDFGSVFPPIEGIYGQAKSIYIKRFETAVLEHNLEVIHNQTRKIDNAEDASGKHSTVPSTKSEGNIREGSLILRIRNECKNRNLKPKQTVPRDIKYDIAKSIGLDKLVTYKKFKWGESSYQRISKLLSVAGYSQKKSSKY